MAVPFEIKGIDHVVIRASDIGRMMRFYCDVLGCVLERAETDLGLFQLRAGNSLVDLVDVNGELGKRGGPAPGADAHNMDHLCLGIDPFNEEALRSHLEANGIDIGEVGNRYGAEGRGPSMYIRDPENNVVELKGPAE